MRKRTIIFGAVMLVLCIYTAVASRMVYGLNIYTVSYGIGRVFSLTYIPVGIAAVVALVVFAVLFAKDYPRIKSIVSPKLDALAERIDRSMADSAQRKRAAAMSYVPYGAAQPMQQPVQPMQNSQFTQPMQQPVQPMQNNQFTQPVQQPVQPMQNAQFIQPMQQPVQPQMPETVGQETNDAQANETAQNDAPADAGSENVNNTGSVDNAGSAENANESPNTNTAKFCGTCGAPITPGQKFCAKCGRQLLMEDGHGN